MTAVGQENDMDKLIAKCSEELAIIIVSLKAPKGNWSFYKAKGYVDKGVDGAKTGVKVFDAILEKVGTWAGEKSAVQENWQDLQAVLQTFSTILGVIPGWGGALSALLGFFATEPEKKDPVVEKLNQIIDQLNTICTEIKAGFSKVVAHSDAAIFRENVEKPINRIWNSMLAFTASGDEDKKTLFLENVKAAHPDNLLSDIETYVSSSLAGVLETQLEANNYHFDTMKLWTKEVLYYASLLPMIQMHYYGVDSEIHDKKYYENKIQFMLTKIRNIAMKLEGLAQWRQKMYFSKEGGKFAKEDLKSIVLAAAKQVEKPTVNLGKVQAIAEAKWREFNGPAPFCLLTFFGSTKGNCHTVYHVGDKEKCVVAENIFDSERDTSNTDCETYWDLCAAVVQPLTREMVSNHHYKWKDAEGREGDKKDSKIIHNGFSNNHTTSTPFKQKDGYQKAIEGIANVLFIVGTSYSYETSWWTFTKNVLSRFQFEQGHKGHTADVAFSPLSDIVPAMNTHGMHWMKNGIFKNYFYFTQNLSAVIYG